jgi:molybdopterin-guanine dinucleotide biosynthesis adapter protein
MKVIAFSGYSGAGKTTLMEGVMAAFKARGLRVSVVKHAHAGFDMDKPGKDSHRHRAAGAFEVLVASKHRSALLREYEKEMEVSVHHLIAQLYEGVDWVLVEGFKHGDLRKIEVFRPSLGKEPRFDEDDFIVGMATDDAAFFQGKTLRPVFDLNAPSLVAQWLLDQADRFEYDASNYTRI